MYFEPLPLYAAAIGALWTRLAEDLPLTQDHPPLGEPPPLDAPVWVQRVTLLSSSGTLPRVWFLSADRRRLVQLQSDRFCFNWRKLEDGDPYPRFDSVFGDFVRHRATFEEFAADAGFTIRLVSYELSYLNRIPAGELVPAWDNVSNVLPDLGWRNDPSRTLHGMDSFLFSTAFPLPRREDGRLFVAVRSDEEEDARRLRLDLTARGPARDGWFERAHDRIVAAFDELTSERARRSFGSEVAP